MAEIKPDSVVCDFVLNCVLTFFCGNIQPVKLGAFVYHVRKALPRFLIRFIYRFNDFFAHLGVQHRIVFLHELAHLVAEEERAAAFADILIIQDYGVIPAG